MFHFLEPVAVVFEHGKAVIDDGIEQGVQEEARVVAQKLRARRVQAATHRVEHVAGLLLERQQRLVADEEADLLEVELAVDELNHPGDHEQPGGLPAVEPDGPSPYVLHLRALRDVEHVLERQRMELILLSEGLQHRHVGEAVHVDPAHRRPLGTMLRPRTPRCRSTTCASMRPTA